MFGHHSKTYYKYLASYGALLLTAIIAPLVLRLFA